MRSQRPSWRARTIEAVERDRTVGLPIYGSTGPRLSAGFPWAHLPRGPFGDLLYAVKPHRFSFAPRWALAALYGAPVADELQVVLDEWATFAASPRGKVAYASSLVVIQRVLALSCAWAFLAARPAGSVSDEGLLEFRILQILAADVRFLAPRLGSSYPNNHLLLDRLARWFCGAIWPEFMPTDSLKHDEELWLSELERQTFEDGGSFEHSTHYHEFACEMAVLYLRLCQTNGWQAPQSAVRRAREMLRFQADLGGPESIAIRVGNATEDSLLPLDSSEGWGTAALREIYRAWFDARIAPAPEGDPAIERAFWLLGGRLAGADRSLKAVAAPSVYRDAGLVILPNADAGSRLTLRGGPAAGAALSAGHAHADLLSIYLSVASTPLIVDAGTYTYRLQAAAGASAAPAWRRYFAGPRAHNGPAIGDSDPLGALAGHFRFHSPARVRMSRLHVAGRLRWIEGEIEGAGAYSGWRRGVIHLIDEYWVVYDLFPDNLPGEAGIGMQFAPDATVTPCSALAFSVRVGPAMVAIAASAELQRMRVLTGETDPLGGWVSPAYGQLKAAPQVRFAASAASRISAFVLKPAHEPSMLKVETTSLPGRHGLRVWCGDHVDDFHLDSTPERAVDWVSSR